MCVCVCVCLFLNHLLELICSLTAKWLQLLLSNSNNSISYQSFVCIYLNGFKYCNLTLIILKINFLFIVTFCPHLGSFCVVSSFATFRPNFTSGLLQVILPRPRIGMLSLVITAFHSCCLSHHVQVQKNSVRTRLWKTR